MNYNIYKKDNNSCENKPNNLLQKIYNKIDASGNFLDLGCGQGRDSLFILGKGFNVTMVDKSEEEIKRIKEYIQKNNLPKNKINLHCQDIGNYNIKDNKFDIINAFNSLQFLPKKESLRLIDKIKKSLKNKGYVIISSFTVNDPLYEKTTNDSRCFFESQELRKLFSDFNIIFYKEEVIEENGHPGYPEPHHHHLVRLIAQKIKNG